MQRVDVAAKLFDIGGAFYSHFLNFFEHHLLLLIYGVVCLLRNHHDRVHELSLLFVLLFNF